MSAANLPTTHLFHQISTLNHSRTSSFNNFLPGSKLGQMAVSGALSCGIGGVVSENRAIRRHFGTQLLKQNLGRNRIGIQSRRLRFNSVVRGCGLISDQEALDYDLGASNLEERLAETRDRLINPIELVGTAADATPSALELASAGVSISIFNIVSKVFNIPLLSVATSFVAEDIAKHAQIESDSEKRRQLPSVSTALVLSVAIGIIEAAALYFGAGMFLTLMGISSASSMRIPAKRFLQLRALGAPAVVLSLAIQGIFRGFKDTKTPVFCLGLGNLAAVFFFPILMYVFGLGVTGAAISTIASQYIVTFAMMWHLNKKTVLKLPKMKDLHFGGYLKSGGFLLGRTLAAVATVTLSTSMAARQGPIAMAAHQICLQVWLSSSLLADAQASAGQALIASSFSEHNYSRVKEITFYALKFVSASQPITALAYIYDGLHYGVSDFSFAAVSMMLVGGISSAFLLYAPGVFGLAGVWAGLTLFMGMRAVAGYIRLLFHKILDQGKAPTTPEFHIRMVSQQLLG
ncbi:Multi antimicrobial extrusion protein [Cynara cardunculus var. scolymus]|uniref:Protein DETOXIFICATION n=1 Tax=Cynara cardunculus var. scolymus TaxID=59895 RepID=A0A103Y5M8_CYNCS|nr:Multi antimicrobial extrusion protein [Cynara cardunculus var. scolymus]